MGLNLVIAATDGNWFDYSAVEATLTAVSLHHG